MKINLALLFLIITLNACNYKKTGSPKGNSAGNTDNATNKIENTHLPFIGKRTFETRRGISGTGTPHRFVEVAKDGEVVFSFEQENQADGTITSEKYYAGKYNAVMKCIFKKNDNEIRYYELTKDTIYEVDANGHKAELNDCCNDTLDDLNGERKCDCKGVLDATETE